MQRQSRLILGAAMLAIAMLACNAAMRQPTPLPQPTAAVPTPTSSPSPAAPASQPATDEPAPAATIPPYLTSMPGIVATLTAVFSTPGMQSTLAAQSTMQAGTQAVLAPQIAGALLPECPSPSDPPMQDWLGIPVMPQATAGQEVRTLVGVYYCFRAPVTAQDVDSFYKQKLTAPQWLLESDSAGTLEFIGISQAGAQLVVIASKPSDKGDLLVAINVSGQVAIPTP